MAGRSLNPSERVDWLRLLRSENVGPITFYQLLQRFGSATAALAALPDLARRGGRARTLRIGTRADAERELARIEALSGRFLFWGEPEYPTALAALDDAPPALAALGNVHLLQRPAVAVVGARNASANGRRMARELAAGLGQAGLLIVSGLARGIDAAAHAGALESGTAAVLAGGVDVLYPPEHQDLYDEIVGRGVVVAEAPMGTTPQAGHFPRRNRIISGLALGVVVVEAAQHSGSLITARFALEQGREVFAVPGSPLDPRCRGTNDLIRGGATLTESAEDVVQQLAPVLTKPLGERRRSAFTPLPAEPAGERELEEARRVILQLLGPHPVQVDELVRECQLSPALVVTVLLELELAGRIERHPGHQVSLV